MGLTDDVIKLAKLKARRAKEDFEKYIKKELKKEERRAKKK